VLIDARYGIQEQTRRHSLIASMLGIDHLLICVNKMDLQAFSEDRFLEISSAYTQFARGLHAKNIVIIPMSALLGDNVVSGSENMPWYKGPTLLEYLEEVVITKKESLSGARLPIQCVIRPGENEMADTRYYAGRMAAGNFNIGDAITILPEQVEAHITGILLGDKQVAQAKLDSSVAISIDRHIDIGRGSMLVNGTVPNISKELEIKICWMAETPLNVGKKYLVKHTSADAKCVVQQIISVTDTNTLTEMDGVESLKLNDLGRIKIKLSTSLCYDLYTENRVTGSLILIDEHSNITVGAGMICN
jgi:sulfate adenylyltransferase subunit 1